MADEKPSRQPVTGSCHCRAVQYVAFLTLPPVHNESSPPARTDQRIYRCNCTICQKTGFLHVRVADRTDDFLLLAPLDPLRDLGDYRFDGKMLHWLFCKTCGVRCFTFMGAGEVVEADLAALGVPGYAGKGKTTRVWRAAREGGHPEYGTYISINGHTVDHSCRAFDARALHEQGSVQYLDYLCPGGQERGPDRYGRPHEGGAY
ncbi:uncharacterized protein UV8b_04806 [Ustilaginoidea virens]|uniref:CENP-V/GFA domain-containing protein n=1 Tax=Ustilaginoidea virens TaxID=1159556 RepID=A0A1B5KX46_USTVR|nr:uncharacterized protein UV8b_04806 [Ustilaginoidea virens]QUC20565.1 hypothetical protein UV8b_04806 [Ustilaginoidea virens]GAO15627.1 hypothetical protein UVI_02050580 [Ustilaginoidea virens]